MDFLNSGRSPADCGGFTLIELSIVLVIIGFIVGGVLVGQDLIRASGVRAQLTQIEKYNTAVNTFKVKYNGYLPGDITPSEASKFSLSAGSGAVGHGDGDNLISQCISATTAFARNIGCETMLFWVHLSQAGLISETFNLQGNTVSPDTNRPAVTTTTISQFIPAAKIGNGNYVAIFTDTQNLFPTKSAYLLAGIIGDTLSYYSATASLTPVQAFMIDTKIDDGLPGAGNVMSIARVPYILFLV